MGVHKSVIDRLMQRFQAAGMIDESSRSGRPRKSTPRENRVIVPGVPHQLIFVHQELCKFFSTHKEPALIYSSG